MGRKKKDPEAETSGKDQRNGEEEAGNDPLDNVLMKSSAPEVIPTYVAEISKSGRAECRKCETKIQKDELRVGVITEGDWGLYTKWQHIQCTIFHKSITSPEMIDGYKELSSELQLRIDERIALSVNEVDVEGQPLDPDELVRKDWSEEKEPSDDLLMPLLPYQKEGLGWMSHQESTSMHGGILADEMGMGKTIQAISLILDNRPNFDDHQQESNWIASDRAHGVDPLQMVRGGTLLILPTVAIRQWQMEIARFTRCGSLRVKVYHGANRDTRAEDLVDADVIITSYKVLEMEYRKATAGTKVECRICNRKFYPEKLRIHRKYFCGESAQRTAAQSKTQKKKARITSKADEMDDQDNDDSDDDEIAKQKKLIKSMKSSSSSKTDSKSSKKTAKSTEKAKPKGKGKQTEKEMDDDKSEDEIDKQKRLIKEAASKRGKEKSAKPVDKKLQKAVMKLAASVKSNDDAKTKGTKTINDDDDSDVSSLMLSNTTSKKTLPSKAKTVKRVTKTSGSKRKRSKSGVDSNSDEESEYEAGDDDDSDESDSDSGDDSLVEEISKKKGVKGKSKATPNKSKATKGKGKGKKAASEADSDVEIIEYDMNEDDDEEDSETMREVEEDIKAALVEAAKNRKKSGVSRSPLHEISWFRVILDEAHLIKDRSTSTAKAIFNLVSLNKWCLTGTPLQNRVGELYSLVRFLRIDPHAYYYCKTKGCSCKSLHYRFTKGRCDDCQHSAMYHFSHFNKHILNPIKRSGYINEGRKAMLKLKEQLLDEILLRRTKTTRAQDIQLPPRIVQVQYKYLDDKEEDFYQALYTQSQAQFNTYVTQGTVLNNYAHIFDILIKLRQAVDHPYLVIYSDRNNIANKPQITESSSISTNTRPRKSRPSNGSDAATGAQSETLEDNDRICGICGDMIDEDQHCRASCDHNFCRDCILDHINTTSTNRPSRSRGNTTSSSTSTPMKPSAVCPVCDEPLSIDLASPTDENNDDDNHVIDDNIMETDDDFVPKKTEEKAFSYAASIGNKTILGSRNRNGLNLLSSKKKNILDKVDLNMFQSSSKMEALMRELHKMDNSEHGCKAIVFSQFVNMLDLLEYRITLGGLQCVKLLGYMSIDQRDKVIKSFKDDPEIKVLLISLKAGGVALNLTVANHIFIMDPWWNPAAEMQAIDRTHRLGQRKPIYATRFIIQNTIEERILKLQEKKRLVFDGTIGGDAGSMAKLTVDDMRFLFQ